MNQSRLGTLVAPIALITTIVASLRAEPAPVAPAAVPTTPPPPSTGTPAAAEPTAAPPPTAPTTDTAAATPPAAEAGPAVTEVVPSTDVAPSTEALAEEEPPRELGVGKQGFIKFGALLQFWGLTSLVDDETATTFRLRRAELKASGEIVPETIAYKLMLDPAKVLESRDTEVPVEYEDEAAGEPASVTVPTPGDKLSVLQDFAITFLSDYADISVGQFKNGLSYEGMTSSAKLLFPERSPVARAYGDKRDLGISVEKGFDHFRYFAGVFNGTGLNLRDNNNQKDLALRLEVLPTTGLLFGAVGYTSLGQRDQATTKDRVEVDARLELSDFLVQAEYLRGWDGPSDASVTGHGFYGALGYTFLERLQPVVRVGQLDLDLDADGTGSSDELTHLDLGLNYYILGPEARLSASASVFMFDDEPTQTDIILAAQASF